MQAFSQDSKSGCPKCAIRPAQIKKIYKATYEKLNSFLEKVVLHRTPGHPSG